MTADASTGPCPCEADPALVASPERECDESPRVCARHGVDPCHDDAWHHRHDPASTGIPCSGPAPPQTFHYGPHPDCPECGPDYASTGLDAERLREGIRRHRDAMQRDLGPDAHAPEDYALWALLDDA